MVINDSSSDGVEPVQPVTRLTSDILERVPDFVPPPEFDLSDFLQEGTKISSPISMGPNPPEFALVEEASAAGDLATVKSILDQWNKPLGGFTRALTLAMESGHLSVAATLLEHGLKVNGYHVYGAVKRRAYPFLQLFLDHGYNINSPDYPKHPGILAEGIDDEHLTRWLLDHGADPNAERICLGQKMGETPCSFAMWKASWSTIQLLFERGGPETLRCGHLLWYAVHRRLPDRLEVMEYLLRNGAAADVRSLEYEDRPEAARQADWVIGRGTPLHTAASGECLDAVKLLIAWGADPAQPDSKGRLPINEAKRRNAIKDTEDYLRNYPPGDHEGVIAYLESLAERKEAPVKLPTARLERL
ncbi:MAG: hypothetical protein Q9182_002785 [Xanthomendoza sp. 2 TL-2023]